MTCLKLTKLALELTGGAKQHPIRCQMMEAFLSSALRQGPPPLISNVPLEDSMFLQEKAFFFLFLFFFFFCRNPVSPYGMIPPKFTEGDAPRTRFFYRFFHKTP